MIKTGLFILISIFLFLNNHTRYDNTFFQLKKSTVELYTSKDKDSKTIIYLDKIDLGISHNIESIETKTKKYFLVKTYNNIELDFLYAASFIDDSVSVLKTSYSRIRNLKDDLFYTIDLKSKYEDNWESNLYCKVPFSDSNLIATLVCTDSKVKLRNVKSNKNQTIKYSESLINLDEIELKKKWEILLNELNQN